MSKSSMPPLESLKDQSATVTFISNVYSSLVDHLGLDLNREEQFPIVAQMLKDLYKSQKLTQATPIRPLTKDEEYVFLADYVISEFRGAMLDKIDGVENFLEVKNGALLPVLQQVTSSLMQQFLGIMALDAVKKYGIDAGLPLISEVDGVLVLSLFTPDEAPEKELDLLANVGAYRSKYVN